MPLSCSSPIATLNDDALAYALTVALEAATPPPCVVCARCAHHESPVELHVGVSRAVWATLRLVCARWGRLLHPSAGAVPRRLLPGQPWVTGFAGVGPAPPPPPVWAESVEPCPPHLAALITNTRSSVRGDLPVAQAFVEVRRAHGVTPLTDAEMWRHVATLVVLDHVDNSLPGRECRGAVAHALGALTGTLGAHLPVDVVVGWLEQHRSCTRRALGLAALFRSGALAAGCSAPREASSRVLARVAALHDKVVATTVRAMTLRDCSRHHLCANCGTLRAGLEEVRRGMRALEAAVGAGAGH